MANEIKSINGRKVCDEKAREDIASIAIPSKLSELTNDSGFITNSDIPTNVSDLTNDAGYLTSVPEEYVTETELALKGYLTEHQDISGKADITDVYTKTEIDTKLGEIETLLEGV